MTSVLITPQKEIDFYITQGKFVTYILLE